MSFIIEEVASYCATSDNKFNLVVECHCLDCTIFCGNFLFGVDRKIERKGRFLIHVNPGCNHPIYLNVLLNDPINVKGN